MNRLVFRAKPAGVLGRKGGSWNLLMILVPIALVAGTIMSLTRDAGDPGRSILAAYLTFTALWFTLATNLVEVGENDRMRAEIDPVLLVLLVDGVGYVVRRLVRSR